MSAEVSKKVWEKLSNPQNLDINSLTIIPIDPYKQIDPEYYAAKLIESETKRYRVIIDNGRITRKESRGVVENYDWDSLGFLLEDIISLKIEGREYRWHRRYEYSGSGADKKLVGIITKSTFVTLDEMGEDKLVQTISSIEFDKKGNASGSLEGI